MTDESLLQVEGTQPEAPEAYDWKLLVEQLNQLLRLRTTPIGMKLFETVSELENNIQGNFIKFTFFAAKSFV